MINYHKLQAHNIEKCIESLEIAKSYCGLAWSCAPNNPEYALSAELEPFQIQDLIDAAKYQLACVGAV